VVLLLGITLKVLQTIMVVREFVLAIAPLAAVCIRCEQFKSLHYHIILSALYESSLSHSAYVELQLSIWEQEPIPPAVMGPWWEWKATLRSRKRHVCYHLVWYNTNSFSVGCSAFSEHPEEYPPRRLWPNCSWATIHYNIPSSCVCVHAVSLRMSNADCLPCCMSTMLHLASSIGQLNPIEPQQTSALELLLVCYFRILLVCHCALYIPMEC